MSRPPRFWTPGCEHLLKIKWLAGEKDPEIAEALGTTANAVRVRRCKLGLVCRKITRTSIRDYTDQALLIELTRRLGPLPRWLWSRKPRKLDPEFAGGHFTL